jgi:lipoprotein-releasing system permease protein
MNSATATLALSEVERPRWALRAAAMLLLSVGTGLLLLAVRQAGAADGLFSALALLAPGWGGLVQAGLGLVRAAHRAPPVALALPWRWLLAGAAGWCLGWALLAFSIPRAQARDEAPSAAAHSPLYPPLAAWRDFSPATFAAYAVAILGGEVVLVLLQTFLASGARGLGMAASGAFVLALLAAVLVAFAAGAYGAARARRLAAPEATIAVLYLGTPLPVLLTVLPNFPRAALWVGYRFREVTYVAELIGRPEIAYWLTFTLLVVALALGILSGFVAGGSGTLDLRTGFELFVSARHVQVFRPRLLLGGLVVLLLGVVPPLLVLAVLRAADAAVERTRIRALGLKDPMLAAAAQRAWAEKAQTATAMMTALSVGGVGVGVMALIIVLSVMSGFEADLQTKILGTNAHVVVLKYTDNGAMPEYAEVVKKVEGLRGVIGVTPFIFGQVMIASEGNVDGTIIKGIDPATVGSVTDLPRNVLPGGSIEWLTQPTSIPVHRPARPKSAEDADDEVVRHTPGGPEPVLPGILLGRELAASLRVLVGDRVTAVSPLGGGMGPTGPVPRSRAFRVAGIFYTGMYEYDSKFAYISLAEAQGFLDVKGATGVELKVADVDDARRISGAALQALDGYPYRTKDWGEMNRNLFSALRLEKLMMGIILTIIVIVAAGLIVATVTMLVLEKRKEISVLKALGVPDSGVVKIFLAEGLQIGVAGGLLGLLSGLAWCLFIEKVGLRMDPQVYYIHSLPVKVEPLQTALAVVIAVLVSYLASVFPALRAAQVEPVEGLKAE